MALVKCPDCRREVSDSAPACPGCGRPMQQVVEAQRRSVLVRSLVVIVVASGVLWLLYRYLAYAIFGR